MPTNYGSNKSHYREIKLHWFIWLQLLNLFSSTHLLANEVKTHEKKRDTLEHQEVEMHPLRRQETPNRCSEQKKR